MAGPVIRLDDKTSHGNAVEASTLRASAGTRSADKTGRGAMPPACRDNTVARV